MVERGSSSSGTPGAPTVVSIRTQRSLMSFARATSIGLGLLLFGTIASAQATPFLFTVMPPSGQSKTPAYGYYELGYGERTFEPVAGDRIEHAVGVRATLGSSLMLLARTGVAPFDGETRISPRGEVLYSRPVGQTVRVAAGVGYAREYSRTDVMLARFGIGRTTTRSMMHGNLMLEKPMSGERDAVDLITTVGAGRRLGSSVTISVEAVGQDLEGFWEPDEKDGGAHLMAGPTIAVAPPSARWQLTVGGGPIMRATRSGFTSAADRPLPARNGYVLRSAVGFSW
jgi:hypothetical protein